MRTYYIYKASNKINGKSYIGQTIDYRSRLWQHRRCYEKENCDFHDAIKEFGFDNFEWEILETCQEKEDAERLEKYYIEKYDSYRNGYNMNKGGVGGHNSKSVVCLTLEGIFVKRYDSAGEAEKDGFNNADVLLNCKGKLRTCKGHMFMFEDEYIEYGPKTYTKPQPWNMRGVIQCNMNGDFIGEYKSVREASEKTGANRTAILGVLAGRYKSANGFIFVYKENFPIKDISQYKKRKKGKRIAQIDVETGKTIKVFERISDAGKELGVNYKAIHKVVDASGRTAFGYKWVSK